MTYGIKRTNTATTSIMTESQGFLSARFVGVGASPAKEWKTRAGAERAAERCTGSEVFTITDTMNY
jgi:hypothetical protein